MRSCPHKLLFWGAERCGTRHIVKLQSFEKRAFFEARAAYSGANFKARAAYTGAKVVQKRLKKPNLSKTQAFIVRLERESRFGRR